MSICAAPECSYLGVSLAEGKKICRSHYRVWKNTGEIRKLAPRHKQRAGQKFCFWCKTDKPIINFNISNKTLGHHYPACSECQPEYLKAKGIKRRYKMDYENYLRMVESGCEVCGSNDNLYIDHNHECCPTEFTCGKCIRGVLCRDCNFAEGLISTVQRAKRLLEYMEKHDRIHK